MREWSYRAPIALIGHDGCKRGSGYNERRNRSTQTMTRFTWSSPDIGHFDSCTVLHATLYFRQPTKAVVAQSVEQLIRNQ